jgi:hypothetical protein
MSAHHIRWWQVLLLWLGVLLLSGAMLDVFWGSAVSGSGGISAVSLSGWRALALLILVLAAVAFTIVWLRGRRRHVGESG